MLLGNLKIQDKKMVNGKDLRAGNFIKDIESENYFQVDGVNLEEKKVKIGNANRWWGLDEFTILPLTVEWLGKFSFDNEIEVDEELKEQLDLEPDEIVCTNEYLRPNCFVGVCIEGDTTTVTLYGDIIDGGGQLAMQGNHELVYENMSVHQFQNLFFALTGEELAIKSDSR